MTARQVSPDGPHILPPAFFPSPASRDPLQSAEWNLARRASLSQKHVSNKRTTTGHVCACLLTQTLLHTQWGAMCEESRPRRSHPDGLPAPLLGHSRRWTATACRVLRATHSWLPVPCGTALCAPRPLNTPYRMPCTVPGMDSALGRRLLSGTPINPSLPEQT